ncbi:MAG: fatty acid desaturase [Acidobacteriota bacterium]
MTSTPATPTSANQTSATHTSETHTSETHPKPSLSAARYWNELLAPYMVPSTRSALFQLLTTAALFVGGWAAMLWALDVSYWLTLALALPTAGFLIRLFIFQHDCGHGAFFKNRRLNDAVGFTIGVLMLTPYHYWRRTHAIHHGTSGDLDRRSFGDIDTLTVDEYLALSPIGRLGYRLYRSPLVLLVIGPIYQFFVKHRLPLDIPLSWRREWASVLWTDLALAGLFVLGWWQLGLERMLLVHVPILLVAQAVGVWLFYVQHQFEDTYWREHHAWDFHRAGLEGSSFYDLPTILHWFTGNIGFHHIHHLSSRIPNYRLRACFRELPVLHKVTRLTLRSSLRTMRLKLWDPERGKLIGFRDLPSKA